MEFLLPTTMTLTIGSVVAFVTILSSVIGIYYKLANGITALRADVGKMQRRNERADLETEAVKIEQAQQRTTVAVMAEQIINLGKTMDRIDRNVEEVLKRGNDK